MLILAKTSAEVGRKVFMMRRDQQRERNSKAGNPGSLATCRSIVRSLAEPELVDNVFDCCRWFACPQVLADCDRYEALVDVLDKRGGTGGSLIRLDYYFGSTSNFVTSCDRGGYSHEAERAS